MGVFVLAGIGAGALTGVLLAALALRRPHAPAQDEINETVDDLKRRAERILTELSRNDVAAAGQ